MQARHVHKSEMDVQNLFLSLVQLVLTLRGQGRAVPSARFEAQSLVVVSNLVLALLGTALPILQGRLAKVF